MDEFRDEREALKNGTPKQKLEYFWCYYKWHVIGTVAAIAVIASFIYEAVTRKDNALYAAFLNSFTIAEDQGEAYKQAVTQAIGIDPNEYEIMIDTSMYIDLENMTDENTYNTIQKMGVYVAAGEIDTLVTNADIFEYYAYIDYLTDLRTVLTPEQLEAYEPYFYYIDYTVWKQNKQQPIIWRNTTEPVRILPSPRRWLPPFPLVSTWRMLLRNSKIHTSSRIMESLVSL